jgi:transposase
LGQHARPAALFYYFKLEEYVPENHLLRLIDKHVSFAFVREHLKDSYSETGRPSIDPELRLRILLIGYRYGITSERKLVEELGMHLAWRRFTGLGFISRFRITPPFPRTVTGGSSIENPLCPVLYIHT